MGASARQQPSMRTPFFCCNGEDTTLDQTEIVGQRGSVENCGHSIQNLNTMSIKSNSDVKSPEEACKLLLHNGNRSNAAAATVGKQVHKDNPRSKESMGCKNTLGTADPSVASSNVPELERSYTEEAKMYVAECWGPTESIKMFMRKNKEKQMLNQGKIDINEYRRRNCKIGQEFQALHKPLL